MPDPEPTPSSSSSSPTPSPVDLTRSAVDPAIERKQVGEFLFPLGVYPVEDLEPKPGYTLDFESADGGGEGGDLDEWPDRYVFDAVLSAERVPNLVRCLLCMMPRKVFPILDILGHDAFREIDPFVAYDPVGLDRVQEALKQVPAFFYEDGLCGFGAMSEEPFFYFFVDEHKIVTVRVEAELKEQVERLLAAFDLEVKEDAAGVDAAAHEHRSVLWAPEKELRLLNFDEIVEQLRDDWRLVLNIDAETNIDDDEKDLGETGWWCRVRVAVPKVLPGSDEKSEPEDKLEEADGAAAAESDEAVASAEGEAAEQETRYVEVVLTASCLREAEELASEAAELHAGIATDDEETQPVGVDEEEEEPPPPPFVVFADRMTEEQLEEQKQKNPRRRGSGLPPKVWSVRWAD